MTPWQLNPITLAAGITCGTVSFILIAATFCTLVVRNVETVNYADQAWLAWQWRQMRMACIASALLVPLSLGLLSYAGVINVTQRTADSAVVITLSM